MCRAAHAGKWLPWGNHKEYIQFLLRPSEAVSPSLFLPLAQADDAIQIYFTEKGLIGFLANIGQQSCNVGKMAQLPGVTI